MGIRKLTLHHSEPTLLLILTLTRTPVPVPVPVPIPIPFPIPIAFPTPIPIPIAFPTPTPTLTPTPNLFSNEAQEASKLRQQAEALRDDNYDLADRVEWRDSVVKDAEAHNMTPLDLAQDYAKEKGRTVIDIITNVLMCKGKF